MPRWLDAAVEYLQGWLEFQVRLHQQPGCVVALAHRGRIVCEAAFGYADAMRRAPLTPRHRFRVASMPALFNLFMDAAEIHGGGIALAGGFASHG